MPKYFIRLLLILVSISGYSQTKTIFHSISWQEQAKIINLHGKIFHALNFEQAIYFPADSGLPTLTIFTPYSETDKYELKSCLYIPLTNQERQLIPSFYKDTTHRLKSRQIFNDGKAHSNIKFIPIRWNRKDKYYEKLISFELEYVELKKNAVASNAREEAEIGNSVLENGDWYKLQIDKDGVYKIDYSLLTAMGIDPNVIDPRNIKVYGYGGGMLPQSNLAGRPDDLPENAIFVNGEDDNVFNEQDFIIFYGQGPGKWSFDSLEGRFQYEKNLYSDASYYYLTVSGGLGKRVQTQNALPASNNEIGEFVERYTYEPDDNNILHSGRQWFGPIFKEQLKQTFSIPIPGLIQNSFVKITTGLASVTSVATSFGISANGTPLSPVEFSIYNSFPPYTNIGENKKASDSIRATGQILDLELSYNNTKNPAGSTGYLDFVTLNYDRHLSSGGGASLLFRSLKSTRFSFSDFVIDSILSSALIWDVTNPQTVENIPFTVSNSSAKFTRPSNILREYAAFDPATVSAPVFVAKVANQNLHSVASSVPQCIIVSPAKFIVQAERLAAYRTGEGIKTIVATPEQIYNEFSSGRQDISAIRDFLRMVYKQNQEGLKYLLLFGLASYDYKDRVTNNTNHVPVYESRESLHKLDSYSSDDYFGFLDDYEGEWSEYDNDHLLNLGIGRLPINDEAEAEIVVTKIINYEKDGKSLGKWRTGITFIADDGDNNLHVNHAEILSKLVAQNNPDLNIVKIYIDAYPQVNTTQGQTVPQAEERVQKAFDNGTLIVNYSGHGGEDGLTSENLINQSSLRSYKSGNNPPFMITATCEFGRYDNPEKTSAGVVAITSLNGGTIGNLTSTREAFASSNLRLNTAFYNSLFRGGVGQTLGDIFKNTKNDKSALLESVNNRNYVILGDPCLKLAFPKEKIVITKFQDSIINEVTPTVAALSKISLTGKVVNSTSDNTSFNGSINLRMFDKETLLSTKGDGGGFPTTFLNRTKIFHESNTKVVNGNFTMSMIVPKDIIYIKGQGRISMYANDSLINDASGSFQEFIIGGEKIQAKDTIPPKIRLDIAGTDTSKGNQTLSNMLLNIKLTDERGINTSTVGVGHEITVSLDGKKPIILNQYFYTENSDSTSGVIRYPFLNLPKGRHILKVKAWDTSNNSSEEQISFTVIDRYDLDPPVIQARVNSPGLDSTNFTTSTARLYIEVYDSNEVAFVRDNREIEVYLDSTRISFYDNMSIQEGGKRITGSGFLNDLQPGIHYVRIKAYDIFNNTSELTTSFTVIDKSDTFPPTINAYINIPNLDSLEALQLPVRLRAIISDSSMLAFVKNEREIEVSLDGERLAVFDSCIVNSTGTRIDLEYVIDSLLPGKHYLTLKAWDIYGNESDTVLVFTIHGEDPLAVYKFYNYPNPVVEWTTFYLEQNYFNNNDGSCTIEIYSVTGTRVKYFDSVIDGQSKVSEITWWKTDDAGNKLPEGIYFYRILLRSKTEIIENHNYQKLVIAN